MAQIAHRIDQRLHELKGGFGANAASGWRQCGHDDGHVGDGRLRPTGGLRPETVDLSNPDMGVSVLIWTIELSH